MYQLNTSYCLLHLELCSIVTQIFICHRTTILTANYHIILYSELKVIDSLLIGKLYSKSSSCF